MEPVPQSPGKRIGAITKNGALPKPEIAPSAQLRRYEDGSYSPRDQSYDQHQSPSRGSGNYGYPQPDFTPGRVSEPVLRGTNGYHSPPK